MKVKKIVLVYLLPLCAISFTGQANIIGNISANAWNYQWSLNDKPSISGIDQPLEQDFSIDPSMAMGANLALNWQSESFPFAIPLELDFYQVGKTTGLQTQTNLQRAQGLAGTLGFEVSNWITPILTFETYHNQGQALAYDPADTSRMSKVDFKTDYQAQGIRFKFPVFDNWAKDLLVGYQQASYTAPQALYVMLDKNTLVTTTGSKQVDPAFEWQADYWVIGFDKSLETSIQGFNWVANLEYGQGSTQVKSDALTGADKYVFHGTAEMLQMNLAANYGLKLFRQNANLTAGYRYWKQTLKMGQKNAIHIYAESQSQHSGPYLGANISW